MKNLLICIAAALLISSPLLMSCTKGEDVESEKGAIKKMTDEAGEEMANRIIVPLERAKDTKAMIDDNYREMEENLENQ